MTTSRNRNGKKNNCMYISSDKLIGLHSRRQRDFLRKELSLIK